MNSHEHAENKEILLGDFSEKSREWAEIIGAVLINGPVVRIEYI